MVSAAKLTKAQRSIADTLPYSAALDGIFRRTAGAGDFDTAYSQVRPLKHVALVAFSSDSSLAGAFNSNVIKKLRQTIDRHLDLGAENIYIYTIGKKVYEAAAKWECPIVNNLVNLASQPNYATVGELAMHLVERFGKGEVDKVELIYHHFRNAGSQVLMYEDFLPLPLTTPDGEEGRKAPSFAFHGYLPIDGAERTSMIKKLEGRIYTENQTQLFIETPYRNNKLAEELVRTCRPTTRMCIASNISCDDESIRTRTMKSWAGKLPDMNKKPTIFLIYK